MVIAILQPVRRWEWQTVFFFAGASIWIDSGQLVNAFTRNIRLPLPAPRETEVEDHAMAAYDR